MRTAVFVGAGDSVDKTFIERLKSLRFKVKQFSTPADFLFDKRTFEDCVYFIHTSSGNICGSHLIKLLRLKDKVSLIYSISIDLPDLDLDEALLAGADFSIRAPLNSERCIAEIQNHFQKVDHLTDSKNKDGVQLISEGYTILRNGKALRLTAVEFKIFHCLYNHLDTTLSREEIISHIPEYVSTSRTVDAHVCSLRRKIDVISVCIDTVRGRGYQLSVMST